MLHNSDDFQIYFCTELHCRRCVTVVILEKNMACDGVDGICMHNDDVCFRTVVKVDLSIFSDHDLSNESLVL